MALHKVTYITKDMDQELIEKLAEENLIWDIDEHGDTWVNGRRDEAKLQAIADKAEMEKKTRGLPTGMWRKVNGQWLVQTDAKPGEKVNVIRRDGTSAIKYVARTADGLAHVSDFPPAAKTTTLPDSMVYITEDCPSIYGSHLLGHEGEWVTRAFRDGR